MFNCIWFWLWWRNSCVVLSAVDHNSTSNTSLTGLLNDSSSSSSNSYTPEQLNKTMFSDKMYKNLVAFEIDYKV